MAQVTGLKNNRPLSRTGLPTPPSKRFQVNSVSDPVDLTLSSDDDDEIEIVGVRTLNKPHVSILPNRAAPTTTRLPGMRTPSEVGFSNQLTRPSAIKNNNRVTEGDSLQIIRSDEGTPFSNDIQITDVRAASQPATLNNTTQAELQARAAANRNANSRIDGEMHIARRRMELEQEQRRRILFQQQNERQNSVNAELQRMERQRAILQQNSRQQQVPDLQQLEIQRQRQVLASQGATDAAFFPVIHNNIAYANEAAVVARERELLNKVNMLKQAEQANVARVKELPAKMTEKLQKKTRLLKLGVTESTSPVLQNLVKELAELSVKSREGHTRANQLKDLTKNAQQEYFNFVNRDKNTIFQKLKERPVPAPAPVQPMAGRMQQIVSKAVRDITNGWGNARNERPLFGGMLHGSDSAEDNDDEDNSDDEMMHKMMNRLHAGEDPMLLALQRKELASMNLYSATDNADLRSLLESVKLAEQAAEGEAQTPDELTINLLPHQRMGLHWLMNLEHSKNKGGILADDMGLGKTVQMIALMMAHRAGKKIEDQLQEIEEDNEDEDKQDEEEQDKEREKEKDDSEVRNPEKKDVEETGNNSLEEAIENKLREYEEEAEKKKKEAAEKRKKELGRKASERARARTKRLAEAEEARLADQNEDDDEPKAKTNLIVCPVALMNQWQAEIETKLKESADVSVFLFHSIKRNMTFQQLSKYDVVITSFTTLANEYKKHVHGFVAENQKTIVQDIFEINARKKNEPNSGYLSPFYSEDSNFYRIILDEAQWIKNKKTVASISCAGLRGVYRWCLSGTPMQNSIEEIFPLIRFLQIRPYCRENRFQFDIGMPLRGKTDNYDGFDKDKAIHKVRVLLKAILLRREKKSQLNGKPILELPDKTVLEVIVPWSSNNNEQSFYLNMEASSAKTVQNLLNGPKSQGNYSNILTLLLRLRQACLHSELVRLGDRKKGISYDKSGKVSKSKPTLESMIEFSSKLKKDVVKRVQDSEAADAENRFECPICLDTPADEDWHLFYPCGHGLCGECVEGFFEKFRENTLINGVIAAKCTHCRTVIQRNQLISYDIFDRVCNKNQSKEVVKMVLEKQLKEAEKDIDTSIDGLELSPKFKRALDLIKKIISDSKDEKIILFSQFTSLFTLFLKFLKQENINPLVYVGSMDATSRNETVKEFYRDPDQRLMLISLKAGNVGLTLTCANHVIIMDPFWNPYVEEQAQDRAYRIGQARPVTVHRLLIENTVEDRILVLQKKKKAMIESAMSEEGRQHVQRLNRQEIGFLFGLNNLEQ